MQYKLRINVLELDAATNRRNLATVTAEKDLFQAMPSKNAGDQARLYKVFPDAKPADWDTPHRCNENCEAQAGYCYEGGETILGSRTSALKT